MLPGTSSKPQNRSFSSSATAWEPLSSDWTGVPSNWSCCLLYKKKNTELIHSSRQDSMHSCGNLNFGQQSILPKYRMRLRIYLITYFLAIYINQQASGQCSVQVSCFQPSKVPIIQQENCLPNHRTKFYYIIFFFNTPQFQLWW